MPAPTPRVNQNAFPLLLREGGRFTWGVFTLVGFLAVFFQVDGDGDELEVGEEGLVEPVVAGGGLAVVLHAVEDAFDHVPPLVRLPVVIPWGRTVPLGRHNRRQAERLGRQPGRIPLVRAAHGRRPWAASCSSPGLRWILTSVLSLSDTTRTLVFRPPRETPTDREPPFSVPRPRAGGPSRPWSPWRAPGSPPR